MIFDEFVTRLRSPAAAKDEVAAPPPPPLVGQVVRQVSPVKQMVVEVAVTVVSFWIVDEAMTSNPHVDPIGLSAGPEVRSQKFVD